jgi:DNA modification methylase
MELTRNIVENMTEKESFWTAYKELDARYGTYADNSYEHLVHLSRVGYVPIHRWLYYQEGYSLSLVSRVLSHLNVNGKALVLDPFAGSGTTLLAAKERGNGSIGFEINPFSAFVARVKTLNYSDKDLNELTKFKIPQCEPMNNVYDKYELKIIKNLFDRHKLEEIETLKKEIRLVENEKTRGLLFTALLSILENVSNYRKGGNGLKRKRVNRNLDPFVEFKQKTEQIYEDLRDRSPGIEPVVINDSCLNIGQHDIDNIDVSIFSPPYANCFDPFEVYKIELWVGEFVSSYDDLRKKRKKALASNLNADLKREVGTTHRTGLLDALLAFLSGEELWDKRIPRMLDIYFHDMLDLLSSLYIRTKNSGFCVIVVGNSAYGKLAIPTDILLAQMGEKAGFGVKEIITARTNETSSQQHAELGAYTEYLRESLVVLQK